MNPTRAPLYNTVQATQGVSSPVCTHKDCGWWADDAIRPYLLSCAAQASRLRNQSVTRHFAGRAFDSLTIALAS